MFRRRISEVRGTALSGSPRQAPRLLLGAAGEPQPRAQKATGRGGVGPADGCRTSADPSFRPRLRPRFRRCTWHNFWIQAVFVVSLFWLFFSSPFFFFSFFVSSPLWDLLLQACLGLRCLVPDAARPAERCTDRLSDFGCRSDLQRRHSAPTSKTVRVLSLQEMF